MNNKLIFSTNCIEIQCARGDAATYEAVNQFYPVHKNRINTSFKVSPRLAPEILQVFRPGLELPESIYKHYSLETTRRSALATLLSDGPTGNPKISEALTLMPHQQLGRNIAEYFNRFAFFFDTRTGKTPLSISIIVDDIKKNPSHKWLVVCPLILIENAWMEDFSKFMPNLKVVNCHATTKAKRLKALKEQASVYITNTESFATYKEYFDDMHFHGCIVDESSSMKSNKSKVTHALVDFSRTMTQWYILSGTPAPNGEWEYYNQLQSIDYYCVPQSYTQFKQYYFVDTSYNSNFEKLVLRPDRKDELYSVLKKYSLYVDKEDVLTTAGRTFHEVELPMPAELHKHYKKMKDDLAIQLEEDNVKIITKGIAAKLNKLNQISSGFVIDTAAIKENKFYDETNKEWYLLDDFRFKALQSLLDNTCKDEQVLIWANYKAEFEMIKGMLGDRCRCIYGETSLASKTEAIQLFKADKIQYLVANPASADKGLTLTNAHIAIYFSLNWSYELYKQSMERIYGDISKQPKHCEYYVFIAKGTIDRVLYSDVLQGKQRSSYAVLNHLKGDM